LLDSTVQTSKNAIPTPLSSNSSLLEFPEELPISDFPYLYSLDQPYQPTQSSRTETSQMFPFATPSQFPYFNFDDIQYVISRGIVSFEKAEESLRLFQSNTRFFPFVIVPPETSLDSLRRNKPFLLLSILTFGARKDWKLQKSLELRELVSENIMVNGKKSLDLLQSVLVYLSW
jgi:hypothetical protein